VTHRVILLGPPGAGKGTQAARIAENLSVPKVASGDLFRDHQARDTELGRLARTYMERGDLVPDDVTIRMVMEWVEAHEREGGFLLDGFPRTLAQAESLDAMLKNLGTPLERCVAITVDTDAVVQRLLKRAELEGRADDNEETIRERMQVYDNQTSPLLEYYGNGGILATVDGMGGVEEISERVKTALSGS